MTKDILIFDLSGAAAHFRKFYTNSSSLSYSVPPRTVLCGIVAAILGFERDSYYEDFLKKNVEIGVKKNCRTRRIMQSVNYMKITTLDEFQLPKNHTQIPFEMIVGESGPVSYRVYISHGDVNWLDRLEERIKHKKYYYPPYLGAAPFLGQVDYVARVEGRSMMSQQPVVISTLVPFDLIETRGIQFTELEMGQVLLLKEKMPCEFGNGRKIKSVSSYIYDENAEPLTILLKDEHVQVNYGGLAEKILFL